MSSDSVFLLSAGIFVVYFVSLWLLFFLRPVPDATIFKTGADILQSSYNSFFMVRASATYSTYTSFRRVDFASFNNYGSTVSSKSVRTKSATVAVVSPYGDFPSAYQVTSKLRAHEPFFLTGGSATGDPFASITIIAATTRYGSSTVYYTDSLTPPEYPSDAKVAGYPTSSDADAKLSAIL